MMPQAQNVVDTITRSFDNETYSDLTIKCQDKSWKVHRVVVCSQSKVLHACCHGGFKEQYTGIIDLEDDDPIIVEIMLKYFYTGTYFEPVIKNDPANRRIEVSRSSLQNQVLTYILADKYDAQHLMSLLGQRLRSTLDRGSTPEEFLAIVPNVYTIPTPANPLRIIAAEHARANLEDLMQKADGEILRATLKKVPEFAFDVLRLVAGAPLIGHCHTCGPHQSAESIQARCRKCGKGGMSLSRG